MRLRRFGDSDGEDRAMSKQTTGRLASRSTPTGNKEEKEVKKVVSVKPSMAPVTDINTSYPDWSVLERELEAAKTHENAYFLDSSFLRAMTVMDYWLGTEGPFFMPRREFRHRHCIFNLFWQPSAPNWEKSEYVVPPRLHGLLRWYLTRDNFINKEAGNRLQDITERLPQDAQVALSQRGWSLYVMNMVYQSGNQLIFRKDNEKEYQPYFGSTAKAQLRGTTLPEMSADAFDALCRRLALPLLLEKIARLPDLTAGPIPPEEMASVRTDLEAYRTNELVLLRKNTSAKLSSSSSRKRKVDPDAPHANSEDNRPLISHGGSSHAPSASDSPNLRPKPKNTHSRTSSDYKDEPCPTTGPSGNKKGGATHPTSHHAPSPSAGSTSATNVRATSLPRLGLQGSGSQPMGGSSRMSPPLISPPSQVASPISPGHSSQNSSRSGRTTARNMRTPQQHLHAVSTPDDATSSYLTSPSSHHHQQQLQHQYHQMQQHLSHHNPIFPPNATSSLDSQSQLLPIGHHPHHSHDNIFTSSTARDASVPSNSATRNQGPSSPPTSSSAPPSSSGSAPFHESSSMDARMIDDPRHARTSDEALDATELDLPNPLHMQSSSSYLPYSLPNTISSSNMSIGTVNRSNLAGKPAGTARRNSVSSSVVMTADLLDDDGENLTFPSHSSRKRSSEAMYRSGKEKSLLSMSMDSEETPSKRRKLTTSSDHLPSRPSELEIGSYPINGLSSLRSGSGSLLHDRQMATTAPNSTSLATGAELQYYEVTINGCMQMLHHSVASTFNKLHSVSNHASAVLGSNYPLYPSGTPLELSFLHDRLYHSMNAIQAMQHDFDMLSSALDSTLTSAPSLPPPPTVSINMNVAPALLQQQQGDMSRWRGAVPIAAPQPMPLPYGSHQPLFPAEASFYDNNTQIQHQNQMRHLMAPHPAPNLPTSVSSPSVQQLASTSSPKISGKPGTGGNSNSGAPSNAPPSAAQQQRESTPGKRDVGHDEMDLEEGAENEDMEFTQSHLQSAPGAYHHHIQQPQHHQGHLHHHPLVGSQHHHQDSSVSTSSHQSHAQTHQSHAGQQIHQGQSHHSHTQSQASRSHLSHSTSTLPNISSSPPYPHRSNAPISASTTSVASNQSQTNNPQLANETSSVPSAGPSSQPTIKSETPSGPSSAISAPGTGANITINAHNGSSVHSSNSMRSTTIHSELSHTGRQTISYDWSSATASPFFIPHASPHPALSNASPSNSTPSAMSFMPNHLGNLAVQGSAPYFAESSSDIFSPFPRDYSPLNHDPSSVYATNSGSVTASNMQGSSTFSPGGRYSPVHEPSSPSNQQEYLKKSSYY